MGTRSRLFDPSLRFSVCNWTMSAKGSTNRSDGRSNTGSLKYSGTERDIFIFASSDLDGRSERPQRLAEGLATAGRRVFFVHHQTVESAEPGYQIDKPDDKIPLYRVRLQLKDGWLPAAVPLTVVQCSVILAGLAQLIKDYQSLSSLSLFFHPAWYQVVKSLPNSYRIFDASLGRVGSEGATGDQVIGLTESEREVVAAADLVIVATTGRQLAASRFSRQVVLIEDGIDLGGGSGVWFDRPLQAEFPQGVGYLGPGGDWLDIELLRKVAASFPKVLLQLVGEFPSGTSPFSIDLPNVRTIVPVSRADRLSHLLSLDVFLFPFKAEARLPAETRRIVGQCLATGRPVLLSNVDGVLPTDAPVATADTHSKFIAALDRALSESGARSVRNGARRRNYASNLGWKRKAVELLEACQGIKMPRVSVIVLTFNNCDLTRECIKSLLEKSDYPNLEIIVVDNGSTDETREFLSRIGKSHAQVRLVFNSENIGFAAGNNVGLSMATGDYLVLLNNDTVVTSGWVLTLLRHFQDSPGLGLLGPVTNNIGNEARISTKYASVDQMPGEVLDYTLAHMGQIYPMSNAAFFCVMLSRTTYEKCGPISEDYGRGFFEDDDYCRKVEAAGLRIGCAEDVFVHHHLSASFNKLNEGLRRILFERNRAIYERHWGKWIPHFYRP